MFSTTILRLVMLLIPGIVFKKLYQVLRSKKSQKDWEDIADILLFSVLSYVTSSIVVSLVCGRRLCLVPSNISGFFNDHMPIDMSEVLYASVAAVFLALIVSFVVQYNWGMNFLKFIKVTQKGVTGEDVWSRFHNAPNPEWVLVTDHKCDLVYYGWVKFFSESREIRELVLQDVIVYDIDLLNEKYKAKLVYIGRNADDITITVPYKDE